jgi:hypothetical protein
MIQQKKRSGPITLDGVARLKVINSPAYLNKLAFEAYSLFDSNDALVMLTNIATTDVLQGIPDVIPPAFAAETMKLIKKYSLTGGMLTEFIPANVTFGPLDKIIIRHDVLAEITLRDGIVEKIDPVPVIKPTK